MNENKFHGNAIYQPSGKAAEYSPWACNFFTGCSNDCEYCYCKRGVMSHVWSKEPKLKKCFKDYVHAIRVFEKELTANLDEIKKSGLLFSFTTDPMIPGKTAELSLAAIVIAFANNVPVQILTKRTDWINDSALSIFAQCRHLVAFGFTLTGCDELEPGASTNQERIEAMRKLHDMGFPTFASIEPVIDPRKSKEMIEATLGFCDLYKVGLISGKPKDFYDQTKLKAFYAWLSYKTDSCKIYLKDSFLKYFNFKREDLKAPFVNSNYNIFHNA